MAVRLDGVQDVDRALERLRVNVERGAGVTVKALVKAGEQEAVGQLRGKGLDMAHHSIKSRYRGKQGIIFSMMPVYRALSIEEGRRPGEEVPFMQLARWLRGDRYLTGRNIKEDLTFEEAKQVFEVQSRVRTAGVRGIGFMAAAAEAIRKKARGEVRGMARTLERSGGR